MLRGINRQDIFEDDDDYLQMTSILRAQSERYDEKGVRLSPFCIFYACISQTDLMELINTPIKDITVKTNRRFIWSCSEIDKMIRSARLCRFACEEPTP